MRALLGASAGLLWVACAASSPAPAAPELELQWASFEQAWARVRDSYPDPALRGLDWDAVRRELSPEAARAKSADELRPVLEAMLARLGDSHLVVWPDPSVERGSDPSDRSAAEARPPPRGPATVTELGYVRTEVRFEAHRIANGRVGYLSFDRFMIPVPERFRAAIIDCVSERVDGLIIDLRGNRGGLGLMVRGLAGHLLRDRASSLGTLIDRSDRLELRPNPRLDAERFDGPVAVLVDERSASTAEVFAIGLQRLGRARVFGQKTAGKVASSVVERLPNGDLLQLVVADYLDPTGKALEGQGVVPDVVIESSRTDGEDVVLRAATSWIREAGPAPGFGRSSRAFGGTTGSSDR